MSPVREPLHWELTNTIIGAYFTVRRELGPGFPEYIYSNAIAAALRELGIGNAREVPFEVVFHGVPVGLFRADLVVEGKILVEAKITPRILPTHREQARYYLKASQLDVAVILAFGDNAATARIER